MAESSHDLQVPSEWVRRFAPLVRAGGRVLDVACGRGRHVRYFRELGCSVVAIDRDAAALDPLRRLGGVEAILADIEAGPWPVAAGEFDAVVVINYLHRPVLPRLMEALAPGGVLLYETFALGNERFGRPSNPDFLLRPGELLDWALPRLQIVAFEQGLVSRPAPAAMQRLCAVLDRRDWAELDAAGAAEARTDKVE